MPPFPYPTTSGTSTLEPRLTQRHHKDGSIQISLNFKVQYKVRRVRQKSNAQDFYTVSLKHELHPISQGNLRLTLHCFIIFTKFTTLHFQNVQEHHTMTLESHQHNKTLVAYLENHQA